MPHIRTRPLADRTRLSMRSRLDSTAKCGAVTIPVRMAIFIGKSDEVLASVGSIHFGMLPHTLRCSAYGLSQRAAFSLFFEGGRVAIDNNPVERALRPIGRKNWLFAGADTGAEILARAMTIVAATVHYLFSDHLCARSPQTNLDDPLCRLVFRQPRAGLRTRSTSQNQWPLRLK